MYKNVNGYQNEELKGRDFIKHLYPSSQWDYSNIESNEVWDVSGTTKHGSFIGEIKIRYMPSDEYPTAFLEKGKYENLRYLAKKNGLTIFYFNIYKEATMIYKLSKLPIDTYELKKESCPNSSVEESQYIMKHMIHLPINQVSKKIPKGLK